MLENVDKEKKKTRTSGWQISKGGMQVDMYVGSTAQ
jgi:hypothetical protein